MKKKKKKKTNIKKKKNMNIRNMKNILIAAFSVCRKVAFNILKKPRCPFFTGFDMLFLEINVAFGDVLAGNLQDGPSIWSCHHLNLERDRIPYFAQWTTCTLDDAVSVFKVFEVDDLLHVLCVHVTWKAYKTEFNFG